MNVSTIICMPSTGFTQYQFTFWKIPAITSTSTYYIVNVAYRRVYGVAYTKNCIPRIQSNIWYVVFFWRHSIDNFEAIIMMVIFGANIIPPTAYHWDQSKCGQLHFYNNVQCILPMVMDRKEPFIFGKAFFWIYYKSLLKQKFSLP